MQKDARLQEAIAKAKSGHELSARDLFIDIVQENPDHKLAWLWLIGLLDDLDDVILACEEVLRIDPAETRVRQQLEVLQARKREQEDGQLASTLKSVQSLLDEGKKNIALGKLRETLRKYKHSEEAWTLLLNNTTDLDEEVNALAHLQALDPTNEEKKAALRRSRYYRDRPLELAESYEERGEIEKARVVYEVLAAKATDRKAWQQLFREVERLEALQAEEIVHVSPKVTISRLSAGPPLLFLSFVIVQIGFDVRHMSLLMAGEFLLVLLGSFLLAVASVRSEHFLWEKMGNAGRRGTKQLRVFTGVMGIILMLAPFLLLSFEAVLRWSDLFLLLR